MVKSELRVVALFTRAWIEIAQGKQERKNFPVALFTRAWIEISAEKNKLDKTVCRPLHEGVDWNDINDIQYKNTVESPSSRGRGLKWRIVGESLAMNTVALFTRAWIEIIKFGNKYRRNSVALFTRAWIEINSRTYSTCIFAVALFTRAWIEIKICS